jgi:hypothetical protein
MLRAGPLMRISRELSRYRLDLVGMQEVRWEGSGTVPAGEYTLFYGKGNKNDDVSTGSFVHKRIISAVKMVEFVNDRISYITLRGRWFHIIVLNDVKGGFCERLERVFNEFHNSMRQYSYET